MNDNSITIDPYFVYGTAWKEEKTEELTIQALQSGFRAIDTANQRKHYFEAGVGKGIAKFLEQSDYTREDLFLQTKFTYKEGQDHRLPYDPKADYPTQVNQSFDSSLEHLNTDYVDSYILHGPSTGRGLNPMDYEVWETMESLHNDGKTKHIGVSNINAHQLQLLIDQSTILPQFVQNRCYASQGWDKEVRRICNENGIVYQGFSLLTANRNYLSHPKIRAIAENYKVPVQSIVFSFARQVGMLPLTGTTDVEHMKEDLNGINLELKKTEIETIENIAS